MTLFQHTKCLTRLSNFRQEAVVSREIFGMKVLSKGKQIERKMAKKLSVLTISFQVGAAFPLKVLKLERVAGTNSYKLLLKGTTANAVKIRSR